MEMPNTTTDEANGIYFLCSSVESRGPYPTIEAAKNAREWLLNVMNIKTWKIVKVKVEEVIE